MSARNTPTNARRSGRMDRAQWTRAAVLQGVPEAVGEAERGCVHAEGGERGSLEVGQKKVIAMAKRSKHRNIKTVVDGITFDSKGESDRYKVLKCMQEGGEIYDLRIQHKVQIAPGVRIPGAKRASPPIRYFADFCYRNLCGEIVIEDFKGRLTPIYKLKRHLLALQGVIIKEVRA